MANEARYEVRLRPQWRNVEHIRSSVGFCLAALIEHVEAQDAISMVTAELIENAIKYGDPSGELHYLLTLSDQRLILQVTSPLARDQETDELIAMIDWIRSFDDPKEAYAERLQEVYSRTDGKHGGLGLVRVSYEGDCELSVTVTRGKYVTVQACYRPMLLAAGSSELDASVEQPLSS